MASMVSTLSATVSRLTILRKPSLYAHSNLSRPVYPALHNYFNPISAHLSFFSKAQAINLSGVVEDLVVLGIETSCDDTGAAIVRSIGEILSQVVSSQLDLRPRWPLGEELVEGRSEARSLRTARIHPSLTYLIQASMEQQ